MIRMSMVLALALGLTVSAGEFNVGFIPKSARAQEMLRIAAVVNDEVISVYDVLQRTDFQIILGLGQRVSEEARAHLSPLMLRQMIDEKLMMQEVRRHGIQVPDEEVNAYLGALEDANHRPKGSLLKDVRSAGLSPEVLLEQIRSRLGWEILNRQRVRVTRPIADEEIDQALAVARAAGGRQEYRVADLFIAFDAAGGEAAAQRLVTEIIRHLKNGVRFPVLAQQYSNSASAAAGGDLGWIRAGQIDPHLLSVLEKLQPGQVSAPVATVSGFHLLLLDEKRLAAGDLTREDMRIHLFSDRIEAESRRALRDIRQAAVIDIRL